MNLGVLIEVALGLVLVYIIMSLSVLQINEVIAGMMKKRSRDLEKILRTMLAESAKDIRIDLNPGPDQAQNGSELSILARIYQHPLIKTLSRTRGKPSYIPVDKFSLALFDVVMTAGTEASTIQSVLVKLQSKLPETIQKTVEGGFDELVNMAIEYKDDPLKMAQLRQGIDKLSAKVTEAHPNININLSEMFDALLQAEIPTNSNQALDQLKRGTANLIAYNPQLTATLESLIIQAETGTKKAEDIIASARSNTEEWFNNTMDRASGWYKRNAQVWSFSVGLVLAIILNIDTLYIAQTLWQQPALRQSIAATAQSYQLPAEGQGEDAQLSDAKEAIDELVSSLEGLDLPIGWQFEPLGAQYFDPRVDTCSIFVTGPKEDVQGSYVAGIPLSGQCIVWVNPPTGTGIVAKIFGILLTAVMVLQGAPFWFDILRKIVNVRSSGAKPEEKSA
jgi:hypothetical protein